MKDGWAVYVECRIGLYQFGHTIPKAIAQNSCAEWDEKCAVSILNMQFPDDVEQVPDFLLESFSISFFLVLVAVKALQSEKLSYL